MPYSKDKLPNNLPKDFTEAQIDTFISTANSALSSGEDEGAAIAIGLSQATKVKKGGVTMSLSNALHTIISYVRSVESKDNLYDLDEVLSAEGIDLGHDDDDLIDDGKTTVGISASTENMSIVKFRDEEMIAIEPLYAMPMTSDAHGEGMTASEIEKMVDNINKNIEKIKGNIGHMLNTEGFYFVKAWINQCDCMIGDEFVPEGQPIIKVQFTDEKLWQMRKDGKLLGLSVGAVGKRRENPDYTEED